MVVRYERLEKEDFEWMEKLLYECIYVPDTDPRPDFNIVKLPELKKYISDFKDYEFGFQAVDETTEERVAGVWIKVFTKDNPGYGFYHEDYPELSMAVLPDYRGMGIGTLLFELMLDSAKKYFSGVSLSVDPDNPAMHLYERYGFERCGSRGTSVIMKLEW